MALKGAGCTIYESQPADRYCRACPDDVCLDRWERVKQAFPVGQEIAIADAIGPVFVTGRASDERPLSVRWHQPEGNPWDRSTLLLYWKSLDQNREYKDPDDHTQPERVATLVRQHAGF